MIPVGDLGALIVTVLVVLVFTSLLTLAGIVALRGLSEVAKRMRR